MKKDKTAPPYSVNVSVNAQKRLKLVDQKDSYLFSESKMVILRMRTKVHSWQWGNPSGSEKPKMVKLRRKKAQPFLRQNCFSQTKVAQIGRAHV